MKLVLPVRTLLTPSCLSMAAVLLSLGAWLFPSFGVLRKGFGDPEHPDLTSVALLTTWYLLIFMSFTAGQLIGGLVKLSRGSPPKKILDLESNFIYWGFTLLTAIGFAATMVTIFRTLSIQEALFRVSLGQANILNETLHEDYQVGLVSLRYLVIYPASLAIYRIFRRRSYSALNIFNICQLALGVFLSSRLDLIATLVTTALLLNYGKRFLRISLLKIALSAGLMFAVLSAFSASRNASYYEALNESLAQASFSEILEYLGAPFQAEFATAKVLDQVTVGGGEGYRSYTDVIEQLNANSAFVHLHEEMGYASWVYIVFICTFMGFVFKVLMSMGKSIFLLPSGAILYGSAELWRQDIFHKGPFIVWFVMGIGLPAAAAGGQAVIAFIGRLPRTHDADPALGS